MINSKHYFYSNFIMLLSGILMLTGAVGLHAQEQELEILEQQAFKQAVALVEPSVVRIQTVGGLDKVGRVLVGTGPTTGVVVSKDGYIISSAFNFISKPASILVELPGNQRVTAKLIANDRSKMLTLLKIDAKNLTPIQPSPAKDIQVGQWSIAVGRTFEKDFPSMSVGILSALNRIWGKAVQTDAKVSPVNYGGPLVDIHGKALGILVPLSTRGKGETAGVEWYDSGIGFAIPMADVYASLDRLKTGKDLFPGLMGINFKGRDQLGGKPVIGIVRPESPADKAGFKTDDLITQIEGKQVFRQADVKHVLGRKYAGDFITVAIKRDGKVISSKLQLVDKLLAHESGFLGILPVRENMTQEAPKGVGVRYVYEKSPAAEAGIQKNDRIIKFNDQDVSTAPQLALLVNKLRPGTKAKIQYLRTSDTKTVEVQLKNIPQDIPLDLFPTAIPPGMNNNLDDDNKENDNQLPVGRINEKLPNGEHSYWAFVPEHYNEDYQYSLMVWLHPTNDTMEATMVKLWQSICNRYGIIIVAPRATKLNGWNKTDAEFVKENVELMQKDYNIDPSRVFLHGFANGGMMAYHLAFKYRDLFRGVCVIDAPIRQRPMENDPDDPLQFFIIVNSKEKQIKNVQNTVKGLRRLKFPVIDKTLADRESSYPFEEIVQEFADWADSLDRI